MAGYHQFHAVNVAVEETLRAARAARRRRGAGRTRRAQARRRARRPARRRGLAHAGLGQEPDDGVLRRPRHPATRRWRTRRSSCSPTATTSTTSSSARSPAARSCCARRRCRRTSRARPARTARGRRGRRGLHDDPEVLPRGEGRPAPAALRPAEHRRHRRRGAPQPVRLHRRLRPAHARRAAERLVHRLHRHADRADRRQHAGGLRRLHQHLRHPAGGRGQGHGADLLREPAGEAGARTRPSGRRSTPSSRRSTEGEEVERKEKLKTKWAQLEALVGAEKRLEARRRGPGRALREAAGGDGRQGDGRLHEPAHLRRPVQARSSRCGRSGTTTTTSRARSRSS